MTKEFSNNQYQMSKMFLVFKFEIILSFMLCHLSFYKLMDHKL